MAKYKDKQFIPALGYNWLTILYYMAIKITMPEKKFRNRLIEYLNPQTEEQILEFGFGVGHNLTIVIEQNKNTSFIGLDTDPKVKHISQKKFKDLGIEIKLDLYDGQALPYDDNRFDKVFSSLVFHQLEKEAKLFSLKETHRVLNPNGLFIIGDWGNPKSILMRMLFSVVQILDGFETTAGNVKGLIPCYMTSMRFMDVT
tara:strand:- start:5436 stop:6035 length:600 start_codon:yes stop_codon:yes gene_type:complete